MVFAIEDPSDEPENTKPSDAAAAIPSLPKYFSSYSLFAGIMKSAICVLVVSKSIPAAAATLLNSASVHFQELLASSVASRNAFSRSGRSVANFSVTEITSNEPIPALTFCRFLMMAAPTYRAVLDDTPPNTQAMSNAPSARDFAPSGGA